MEVNEVFMEDKETFVEGEWIFPHFLFSTDAVVRRCSSKQVFLKIWQIPWENTCAGVSF